MRALVTGAAGFIGGAVARRLLRMPGIEQVLLLDRDRVETTGRAQAIACDLAELGRLDPDALGRPDVVVHCAGITAAACEADPDEAFRVNVEGTRALLARCRALPRPQRFVLTSSVAVFGDGEAVVDERSRVGPSSTYGATKVMAEALVLDARRRGEVEGVVARLAVTLVRPSRVGRPGAGFLSDLIRHAVEGRAFEAPLPADRAIPVAGLDRTVDRVAELATGPAPSHAIHHIASVAGTGEAAIEALAMRGVAATKVSFRPDPSIERLVAGWPERLASLDDDTLAPKTIRALIDDHLRSIGLLLQS